MKVTRRRAILDDAQVLLELINAAYKGEGKWKMEEKRTNAAELERLLPDQNAHPESGDYQVLVVLVADEGEDISAAPLSAQSSRIVGHIRAEVKGTVAFFGMYAVWPELQGRGLGTVLLHELFEEISATDLRLQRAPTLTFEAVVASENTQLFPIYDKLGFELTGEEVPVPDYFGPLRPGFEHTTLKTISRPLKAFK